MSNTPKAVEYSAGYIIFFPFFATKCWEIVNKDPLKDFVQEAIDNNMSEQDFCDAIKNVKPVLPEPFQIEAQNKYRDIM